MSKTEEKDKVKGYKLLVSYESGMLWLDDGSLIVPSASESGKAYTMGVDAQGHITCTCTGSIYWDRCRHVERTAYFLEHTKPKNNAQRAYWGKTYDDPIRTAIRDGHRPERAKRYKKSELAHQGASQGISQSAPLNRTVPTP